MKKLMLSCLLVFLCACLQAQANISEFNRFNFYNGKPPVTNGKYVILDFFATWCSPCIAALPHMDSLQKTFGSDLQVIAVTKEDSKTLTAFFKNNPRLSKLSVAFIVSDTVLHTKFPHIQIPHEVILDRSGRMLTSTYASALSFHNIQRMVKGEAASIFPIKQDRKFYNTLSLTNQLMPSQMITSQVVIADYIPGAPSISGKKADSLYTRYYFINMPLIGLLQMLHGRSYKSPAKILGLEGDVFRLPANAADTKPLICYEITVPKNRTIKEVHAMMLSDLQSRFNLTTSVVRSMSDQSPSTVLLISKQTNF